MVLLEPIQETNMPLDPSECPEGYVPLPDVPKKRGRPKRPVVPATNNSIPPKSDVADRPAIRGSKIPKHVYCNGIQIPAGRTHITVFDQQLIQLARRIKNRIPISGSDRMICAAALMFLRDNGARVQDEWRMRASEMIGNEGHGVPLWRRHAEVSHHKEGDGVS